MNRTEWSWLLLLSLLWGASFPLVGIALAQLPPLTVVAARVALAAIALLVLLRLRGVVLSTLPWPELAVMAVLNNVIPFTLITFAQDQISAGLAATVNATAPLLTVLAAHWLTRDERITAWKLAGVVVGLAGVAVLFGGPSLAASGTAAVFGVLLAAASYALAGLYGRRFRRRGVSTAAAAAGQVAVSSLVLVPLAMLVDQPWTLPMPDARAFAALAVLGLACTALAYLVYFALLARVGATGVLLVTFLIPPTAVVLGVLLLNETLPPRQLLGMCLIGLGLACVDQRLPMRLLGRFA